MPRKLVQTAEEQVDNTVYKQVITMRNELTTTSEVEPANEHTADVVDCRMEASAEDLFKRDVDILLEADTRKPAGIQCLQQQGAQCFMGGSVVVPEVEVTQRERSMREFTDTWLACIATQEEHLHLSLVTVAVVLWTMDSSNSPERFLGKSKCGKYVSRK